MEKHLVIAESAEKVWNWLQTRRGIAVWNSANLSNPGAIMDYHGKQRKREFDHPKADLGSGKQAGEGYHGCEQTLW